MSAEIAVVARLKATAGVTAIVGQRVYQLVLPQRPTLPAVRVQLIDEPNSYHLRGAHGEKRARIQIDAYTDDLSDAKYTTAVSLADAIEDALTPGPFAQGTVTVAAAFRDSRETLYEAGELRLVRVRQDFIVWWRGN